MPSEARFGIRADTKQAEQGISSVRGLMQNLGKDAKSSILAGVGLGAGVSAFNLAKNAVLGVADALGSMAQSAIDDEASVRRLTQSLQVNIPGWDGNTAAIEKRIDAGMRLGFQDTEQRDSMALLVAATNDVEKSQRIMATAMDLARLKGISLQSASEALIKVEGGRFRMLAALGIELRAGATSTEALAAVQKVAAGQAKAYGETTAGAMAAAEIAIEEAGEVIGRELIPVIKELAFFARDVAVPAVTGLVDAIHNLSTQGRFDDPLTSFEEAARDAAEAEREALIATLELAGGFGDLATALREGGGQGADAASEAFHRIAREAGELPGLMAEEMLANQHELDDPIQQLLDFTEEALTPAQVIARNVGFLTSAELAAGLASNNPIVKRRAEEMRTAALVELANTRGFWSAGQSLGAAWVNGQIAAVQAGKADLITVVTGIRNVYGHSLPTEGPLKGDAAERGGRSIGKAWIGGMAAAIGGFRMDGSVLGSAGTTGPRQVGAAAGTTGTGEIRIYLDGRELTASVARWTRLGAPGGPALLPR